jgi:HSP20 family protein
VRDRIHLARVPRRHRLAAKEDSTMTRQSWDPWRDLDRVREEFARAFTEWPLAGGMPETGDFPPLNVRRSDDRVVIEALIPGADRSSLDVSATGNTVTIRGERRPTAEVANERWHRRERGAGRFVRTVKLETRLATADTTASYRDGILRIEVPVAPEAKPHRVQIAG